MATGKRGLKKQQIATKTTAAVKGTLKEIGKHGAGKKQMNGPAERKRQPQVESNDEELQMSPRRKRARVSPSTHQSKAGTTTFAHDSARGPSSTAPDQLVQCPERQEALLPPTKRNDKYLIASKDGTIPRDDTVLQDVAHAPTPLAPHGNTVSLVKDVNSPDPNLWIPFGRLRQQGHPRVFWELKMKKNGSKSQSVRMGSDRKEANMLVFGFGVGGNHCLLTFELGARENGSLRRRVLVQTVRPPIGTSSLLTRIWVGDQEFQVEDRMVLPPGAILQLGDGERYVYDGPEFASLYPQGTNLHGHGRKDLNSSVMRVQRISDKRPFVAKIIAGSHIAMAKTEIQVFKKLGRHPRIVQFVEAFYDPKSRTHQLVLEAGFTDLWRYVAQMRPHAQDVLGTYAPQWINEITSGINYIHDHDITHRDIKPENILAFVSEIGRVEMKITDMGLARRHTRPVTKQWRAGSPYWFAPASFMAPYQDPKLVDCYGVGRLLFFLLTPHLWPEESEDPQKVCGCIKECRGLCAKRQTAFRVIEDMGVGDECLDFLKHLLVERPERCNNASQMLTHPYISDGIASQE